MIDIIKHFFDLVGQKIWYILFIIILAIASLFAFTFATPISFEEHTCIQKEDQWQVHNVTHTVKSVFKKDGAIAIQMCVTETTKTLHTNLVETPAK